MNRLGVNQAGLGFNRGGVISQLVTPTLPQASSIVRAWSMRRLIDSYGNSNALQMVRDGSPEVQQPFQDDGKILLSGEDAWANVLYDQKGNNGTAGSPLSELRQPTFQSSPAIYENNILLPGLSCNNDYLVMGSIDSTLESVCASGAVTFCAWSKYTGAPYAEKIIAARTSSSAGRMWLGWYNGKPMCYMIGATRLECPTQKNDGKWHHICVTRSGLSGTSNGTKLYVDGVYVAQQLVGTKETSPEVKSFSCGALADGTLPFIGITNENGVNDIMVYSVALSGEEVATLYASTKDYYQLEG